MSGSYVTETPFPRLERQGFAFGLSGVQVLFWVIGVGVLLLQAFTQNMDRILGTAVFLTVPLIVFGTVSIKRRPLTAIAAQLGVWMFRKALKQNRWKINPEDVVAENRLRLPGVVNERLEVYSTGFDNTALIWDAQARTATAVIRCETTSFALISEDAAMSRVAGFAKVCSQVADTNIARVTLIARTIPATSSGVVDYYNHTVAQRGAGDQASPWADEQYRNLLELTQDNPELIGAVQRDILVALTVSEIEAASEIRNAGGGRKGMSYVIAQEVAAMMHLLEDAGALPQSVKWLDAPEVAEVVRTAMEPQNTDEVARRRAKGQPLEVSHAGPMVVLEEFKKLVTGDAFHQVFWVAEWPRVNAPAGFLTDLLSRGSFAHTFTLVFSPVSTERAYKEVQRAKTAVLSQMNTYQKLDRPITQELTATLQDLEQRESEIVAGYSDVKMTGYVTISAQSEEKLGEARASVRRMTSGRLELRSLDGQQAAAFTTANIPVGWGLKK